MMTCVTDIKFNLSLEEQNMYNNGNWAAHLYLQKNIGTDTASVCIKTLILVVGHWRVIRKWRHE